MSALRAAVSTEFLKTRRSRVPWGIAAGFSIAPVIIGLFLVILKYPETMREMGLLGAKAQLTGGAADWPTFWILLGQVVPIGGAVLFAFLTAWVFGREFADRTGRVILANPTPRATIVVAKAIAIATWAAVISAWVIALAMGIAGLVGLAGWSVDEASQALGAIGLAAVLTISLQGVTAFFAGIGRGYLVPLAWGVATVVASQVLVVLGWGAWFPWSVPAVLTGAGGADVEPVTLGGTAAVLVTSAVGLAATVTWWQRADQAG